MTNGKPRLEFPVDFPLKAIGTGVDDFEAVVLEIVRRHVPAEVTLMLLGLCLAWAAFTGHAQGWAARRHPVGWPVFALLVTLVVYITFDCDRQKTGWIRLDATQSLYDLREGMDR